MNSSRTTSHLRVRGWILITLCVITPAGFLFKGYRGPGRLWFNDYGAGVLYEVFWCLVVFFFIPWKRNAVRVAVAVFIVTCALEILQLWHPPFLQAIRSTFLGSALLGTTFVWWDFPHYALGCLIGWALMRILAQKDG